MENEKRQSYRVVGAPIIKKDAMALVTGKPVYTADIAPRDCLVAALSAAGASTPPGSWRAPSRRLF